jgi:hypothetical protein
MKNEETEQAIRQHAVVTHDLEVTSPTPLVAPPDGAGPVASEGPNQPAAREVAVEPAASPKQQGGEYKPSQPSNLPGSLTARQIADDAASLCHIKPGGGQ